MVFSHSRVTHHMTLRLPGYISSKIFVVGVLNATNQSIYFCLSIWVLRFYSQQSMKITSDSDSSEFKHGF